MPTDYRDLHLEMSPSTPYSLVEVSLLCHLHEEKPNDHSTKPVLSTHGVALDSRSALPSWATSLKEYSIRILLALE